jgi:hypothetical protein
MNFSLSNIQGIAEYRARLDSKNIVMSDEMLSLAIASTRTPPYGLAKILSKSGVVSSLVVPNPDIVDIDKERTDEDTGGKLSVVTYLAKIRARYQEAFYLRAHPSEDQIVQLVGDKKDSPYSDKLTEEDKTKIVFLLRWKYMAYAMVSPPDCPTFPVFLFYKGDSGGKRVSDRSNIDNYEPISLDALEFFHYDTPADEALSKNVSTIGLQEDEINIGKEEVCIVSIKFPDYDPRYHVHIFRRSVIGRDLSNVVDPEKRAKRIEKMNQKQQQQQQQQQGSIHEEENDAAKPTQPEEDEAASTSTPPHDDDEAPSKRDKKARKKKASENAEDSEKELEGKNQKIPVDEPADDPMDVDPPVNAPKRRSRAKKSAVVPESVIDDPMEAFFDEVPCGSFRIDDSDDLALLGVPEMQRDDMAINCIWVDRAGPTGHVATPSIAELDTLCRLYVPRTDTSMYPGDLAVRFLLTVVGKHNPGVSLQPFINAATRSLVSTPAIGSMDINQLMNVLTPDIINAGKDHVMRTALADETLRLAHNQHDFALVKAAASASAATVKV